eukprot:scaffold56470_cov54-Phaeocystis_antarctica.AAC.2
MGVWEGLRRRWRWRAYLSHARFRAGSCTEGVKKGRFYRRPLAPQTDRGDVLEAAATRLARGSARCPVRPGPMSGTARAAQGDKRAKVSSTTGSGRHGGASEKVVENVTVERYWPSKAPKWAAGDDDEEKGFVQSASASSAPPPAA